MPTLTHEQTINTSLGEVLDDFGRGWGIRSEQVGRIFDEGGRPDILIEKRDGWPIVIEAEVGNHRQAEMEAQSRLGNRLVSSGAAIHAAVALVYPEELRHYQGAALRGALRGRTRIRAFHRRGGWLNISVPRSWLDIQRCLRVSRSAAPFQHSGMAG